MTTFRKPTANKRSDSRQNLQKSERPTRTAGSVKIAKNSLKPTASQNENKPVAKVAGEKLQKILALSLIHI